MYVSLPGSILCRYWKLIGIQENPVVGLVERFQRRSSELLSMDFHP